MAQKHKTYHIHCGKCNTYTLTYHKFGAGKGILRLYLANIAAPENLVDLHKKNYRKVGDVPNLTCSNCQEVLGVSTTSKGKKWVFPDETKLFPSEISKEIRAYRIKVRLPE